MSTAPAPSSFKINPVNLDFDLPEDLIAQEPLKKRDEARLMVLQRATGKISHHTFKDLISLLKSGDVLVINTAKVSPVKLFGKKLTGGRVEVILINPLNFPSPERGRGRVGVSPAIGGTPPLSPPLAGRGNEELCFWRALVRPELKPGTEFLIGSTTVKLMERSPLGENILRFEGANPFDLIAKEGILPLPPYIKRTPEDSRTPSDAKDYQTVYAKAAGSLAAPTAGLHFSEGLLSELKKKGVEIVEILLHVGWGTFKPVSKSLDQHEMMEENFEVSTESYKKLLAAKKMGRRIISVGTTGTRVLESLNDHEEIKNLKRGTNIFIKPGYEFKWISGLITNFHVPRSTPIALTAAFAGTHLLERAYADAIEKKFRFFSYGDAMLIL